MKDDQSFRRIENRLNNQLMLNKKKTEHDRSVHASTGFWAGGALIEGEFGGQLWLNFGLTEPNYFGLQFTIRDCLKNKVSTIHTSLSHSVYNTQPLTPNL